MTCRSGGTGIWQHLPGCRCTYGWGRITWVSLLMRELHNRDHLTLLVAEIPYLLGSYAVVDPNRPVNADEVAIAAYFQGALGHFVRDPYHGLTQQMGWPTYNASGM